MLRGLSLRFEIGLMQQSFALVPRFVKPRQIFNDLRLSRKHTVFLHTEFQRSGKSVVTLQCYDKYIFKTISYLFVVMLTKLKYKNSEIARRKELYLLYTIDKYLSTDHVSRKE